MALGLSTMPGDNLVTQICCQYCYKVCLTVGECMKGSGIITRNMAKVGICRRPEW